ncbi:MAG: nucleoside deaminase, partial [Acidimicrobiales bacterium]
SRYLEDATLYSTLEPCAMCAGALILARCGRLVIAAQDPKAGAVGSLYNLCCDPRLNFELEVRRDVLAEASTTMLKAFFSTRR